jgi:hypothetical protein
VSIKSLTHKLAFTGNGVLATAKIPSRWTTLVKNRYPVQIARFATRTLGQKELLFCSFYHFYFKFLLQKLQLLPLPSAAQKTIMTNLDKPLGQNMQRKPTDKLLVAQCHLLFDSRHSIILVIKGHVFVVYTFDSLVANGNFMGISPQIFHHRLGTAKRLFGKNYPRLLPQLLPDLLVLYRLFCFEFLTIFSPKNLRQGFHRK